MKVKYSAEMHIRNGGTLQNYTLAQNKHKKIKCVHAALIRGSGVYLFKNGKWVQSATRIPYVLRANGFR